MKPRQEQLEKTRRSPGKLLTQEEVRRRFSTKGFTVLGRYVNTYSKIKTACFCGSVFYPSSDSVFKGTSKSCGCLRNRKGATHPCWRGVGELSSAQFCKIRADGLRRGLEFSVTPEDLWSLFIYQKGRCAFSGELIYLRKDYTKPGKPTASLDRIDSSLGYIRGNVQWVHKDLNLMKRDFSDDKFIAWCRKVSVYTSKRR